MQNILDEERMLQSIAKLKSLKRQEDLNFESLKQQFKSLAIHYHTSNMENFGEKNVALAQKLSSISEEHNQNIMVLEKNLEKYRATKILIEQKFDNMF